MTWRVETPVVAPLVYDFGEVCQALGVNEHIARAWMNRAVRPLPHVKSASGGRVIFPIDAVRQWLFEEATQPPVSPEPIKFAAAGTATKRTSVGRRT